MNDPNRSNIVNGPALSHNDFLWAITIAVGLSLVIACIEIPSRSRSQLRACFVGPAFLYWLVLSFGNVITTLLASLAVVKMSPSLAPYYFILCPFFGVFGFETVLKNTNITMFDKGVLTIQNWIEKALNGAAAAAIDQQENLKQDAGSRLVTKLMALSEEEINTRVLHKMGPGTVQELEAAAKASSANTKQYKILQLVAILTPSESAVLLRRPQSTP